jgi:hypothetical protein
MTSDAAAEQERHRVLADQDRRGYLAHPETAEESSVAEELSVEAWTDLDWKERGAVDRDAQAAGIGITVVATAEGGGIVSPSRRSPSRWNWIASRMRCLTSSSVRPVATQPGSSGLQAE